MRIIFCGDVVGRSGRAVIKEHVPKLREEFSLDAVVVNGENAASGFGITRKIAEGFLQAGVDVITGGDHCFDQRETMLFIDDMPQLLRPANFPASLPGVGARLFTIAGKKLLVVHVLAQLFMKYTVDSPFDCVDRILRDYSLGKNVDVILVDFHAEATSEAVAMGVHLDGRVSAVVGSHTHVPTADARILPGGTAYQTDTGMCGDYDSVIGFDKNISVASFLNKVRVEKMGVANGNGTLCALLVEVDDATGLATHVQAIHRGGVLG